MGQKLNETIRKSQMLLMIAFGTVPGFLLILAYFAEPLLPWGWVYPTAYVLLALAGFWVKGKFRMTYGIVMAAAMAGLSWYLAPEENRTLAVVSALFYSGLMIGCLEIARWSPEDELPSFWFGAGLGLHLFCQLVLLMNKTRNNPVVESTAPFLRVSFFLFILLSMLAMNRGVLVSASAKRQTVSAGMKGKNTLLTLAVFGIASLMALLPTVVDGIRAAVIWLFALIRKFFEMLTPKIKDVVYDDISGDQAGGMGMLPAGETSRFVEIITPILMVAGALVALALLVVWLGWLFRLIGGLIRRLIATMTSFASAVSEDFEDEITDTREEVNPEHFRSERKRRRMARVDEKNLSPADRIRYRYLRLKGKHPEWSAGSTARETLPEKAAMLYEKARYSNHPVSQTESEMFGDLVKRV